MQTYCSEIHWSLFLLFRASFFSLRCITSFKKRDTIEEKKIMLPWSLHCKPWTHKWPIPSGWRRTGNELGRTIMIITKIEVILQNLCCQPLWKQEQIWRKTQIQRRWHYGQPTMFLMIRTSWKVTLVSPKNLLPLYHSSVVNGEKNDVEVRNNSTPQAVLTW